MFKVLAFLTKRDGIEMHAFVDYCENNHVPCMRSGPISRLIWSEGSAGIDGHIRI